MDPSTRRILFMCLSAVCASVAIVAVLFILSDSRRAPRSALAVDEVAPAPVRYHFEDEEFCPGGLSRLAPLARMADGGCSYVGHLVNTAEGCAVHLFRCPTLPRPSLGAAASERPATAP